VVCNGQQEYHCRIRENISLALTQLQSVVRDEKVRIFIDPDMILPAGAAEKDKGSNLIQGSVVKIASEDGKIRLVVDIGVPLILLVSRDVYEISRPMVGAQMGVYIPPDAIRLLKK
jgi:hypothetical protein